MCQNINKPYIWLICYFKYFCEHSNITLSNKKSIEETDYKKYFLNT